MVVVLVVIPIKSTLGLALLLLTSTADTTPSTVCLWINDTTTDRPCTVKWCKSLSYEVLAIILLLPLATHLELFAIQVSSGVFGVRFAAASRHVSGRLTFSLGELQSTRLEKPPTSPRERNSRSDLTNISTC
ncbi:hypothetical protein BDW75DRAFT_88068 [Aspergillus navahoensis]